jgi:hypothetical protein
VGGVVARGAGLLREYRIVSKAVGPKDQRAKGYQKVDFADAWERYLPPKEEMPPSDPDDLQFTRSPPCNYSAFAKKSAVHREPGEREKIDDFSSNITAVNGWTGKKAETVPCPDFSTDPTDDGIPDSFRRCRHCGRGDGVERWDLNGRTVWLHEACTSSWRQ